MSPHEFDLVISCSLSNKGWGRCVGRTQAPAARRKSRWQRRSQGVGGRPVCRGCAHPAGRRRTPGRRGRLVVVRAPSSQCRDSRSEQPRTTGLPRCARANEDELPGVEAQPAGADEGESLRLGGDAVMGATSQSVPPWVVLMHHSNMATAKMSSTAWIWAAGHPAAPP